LKPHGFIRRLFSGISDRNDHEGAHVNAETREMIEGIYTLADRTVREVMVPRIDSIFLNVDMDPADLAARVSETGHSRFPVYRDTIDNVVGMLYAKDLLQYLTNGESISTEKIIRKPYFVPESKRLDSLMREMKRRRVHIAVAVDEYGGVSGIVCLEDIIEEIVGDIQDEFDNERSMSTAVSRESSAWKISLKRSLVIFRTNLTTNGRISSKSAITYTSVMPV